MSFFQSLKNLAWAITGIVIMAIAIIIFRLASPTNHWTFLLWNLLAWAVLEGGIWVREMAK